MISSLETTSLRASISHKSSQRQFKELEINNLQKKINQFCNLVLSSLSFKNTPIFFVHSKNFLIKKANIRNCGPIFTENFSVLNQYYWYLIQSKFKNLMRMQSIGKFPCGWLVITDYSVHVLHVEILNDQRSSCGSKTVPVNKQLHELVSMVLDQFRGSPLKLEAVWRQLESKQEFTVFITKVNNYDGQCASRS